LNRDYPENAGCTRIENEKILFINSLMNLKNLFKNIYKFESILPNSIAKIKI